MNKKIITIAEVVFALIFVILLALFMSTIITKGNSTNTQLIDTLETTGGTSLNSYDHATMKGESVISAIRNVKSIGDGTLKLEIDVYTLKSVNQVAAGAKVTGTGNLTEEAIGKAQGQAYGYFNNKSTDLIVFKAKDPTDTFYINPTSDFHSVLCYNNNNICIGIIFYQEGLSDTQVNAAFDGNKSESAAAASGEEKAGRNNGKGDKMYCAHMNWRGDQLTKAPATASAGANGKLPVAT